MSALDRHLKRMQYQQAQEDRGRVEGQQQLIQELEAENERLRKAAQAVVDNESDCCTCGPVTRCAYHKRIAALAAVLRQDNE